MSERRRAESGEERRQKTAERLAALVELASLMRLPKLSLLVRIAEQLSSDPLSRNYVSFEEVCRSNEKRAILENPSRVLDPFRDSPKR